MNTFLPKVKQLITFYHKIFFEIKKDLVHLLIELEIFQLIINNFPQIQKF